MPAHTRTNFKKNNNTKQVSAAMLPKQAVTKQAMSTGMKHALMWGGIALVVIIIIIVVLMIMHKKKSSGRVYFY
jgi:lipopolysaccharide/colanic/teichoic acid biosynthesis glycosyltransferase